MITITGGQVAVGQISSAGAPAGSVLTADGAAGVAWRPPASPWYSGLYIAYEPLGAASQAASYINLANPGTNDAIVGSAPTWHSSAGWMFNGSSQHLICNVVPAADWTMICQYSHVTSAGITDGVVAGSLKSVNKRFWVWPSHNDLRVFGYGGDLLLAGKKLRGNMSFSANSAYYNGVGVGTIGAGTYDFLAPYIGALNVDGSASYWLAGSVQRFALHNGTLSASEMAAIVARMTSRDYYMVTFGDSITAGDVTSDAAHRWANIVAAARGFSLTNAGISASVLQNTVQNTVETIGSAAYNNGRDRYVTSVLNLAPDVVLILYGLNDLRLNDASFSAVNFENDLTEIVTDLINRGIAATSIVIGSPPYIPAASYANNAPWDGGSAGKHAAYVSACAAVAGAKGTKYVNVYDWMANGGGDTLISPDGIHPNDAGHAVIASAFLSVL